MKIYRNVISLINKIFFPQPVKPPYLHVCQVGDPVLRMAAEKVQIEDINHHLIQKIISQMIKVMRKYKCNGLSAPQIGIPLRIFLMEVRKDSNKHLQPKVIEALNMSELPLTVFINPEMKILEYDKLIFAEGCSSVRGFSAHVPRYKAVTISGWNKEGKRVSKTFSGWLARIAQHEMDHLDGRLYIDKMELKTFQNDGWHRINVHEGKVQITYN